MEAFMTIRAFLLSTISLIGFCGFAIAYPTEIRLRIQWPEHWEYRPAVERNSVRYLEARQRRKGATMQRLSIAVIDTRASSTPIALPAIRALVEKLRDGASKGAAESIDVVPLKISQGYYFVGSAGHTMERGGYHQLVEGVLLRSGYLINFSLLTDDAQSDAARQVLSALDHLVIDGDSSIKGRNH